MADHAHGWTACPFYDLGFNDEQDRFAVTWQEVAGEQLGTLTFLTLAGSGEEP